MSGNTSFFERLRVELRDALELVLLPWLAVLMPWDVCFALFRRMARWDWLYRESCEEALDEARRRGALRPDDEERWLYEQRLVTLVNHADLYLSRRRSDAWMAHWLDVKGEWPPVSKEAGVLCTFHYGAGMWGLRQAAHARMRANALVAPLDAEHFQGRSVRWRYVRARTREMARALSRPVGEASKSMRAALRVFENGELVLAAVDAPTNAGSGALMQPSAHGLALLQLASEFKTPVTVFSTLLDLNTGRRTLRIEQVCGGGTAISVEELTARVFAHLEHLMRRDTAAWHLWSEAERALVR
ncbi:MAG: hypothetical protein IJM64_02020 [Ottowia sp.]|nr:hypothetical protein [Ottowia sp.]